MGKFGSRDEYEAWKKGLTSPVASAIREESPPHVDEILDDHERVSAPPIEPNPKPGSRRGVLIAASFFPALVLVGVFLFNWGRLQSPMNSVLASDPRNAGIDVSVHYGRYVQASVLIYDLHAYSGQNSHLDILRVLFQFAKATRSQTFKTVLLEFRGHERFILPGNEFRIIGEEFGTQNPVYTLRTLPEKLLTPDGNPAFGTWTGGLLGVLGKQMEDLNEFGRRWLAAE